VKNDIDNIIVLDKIISFWQIYIFKLLLQMKPNLEW
jgi:hypothetical protein